MHQKLEGEASGYKLILWTEKDIPRELTVPHYHFKRRQWAFAADFARNMRALERTGGVYLDVDVEVLRSFDPLLNDVAFVGEESPGRLANGILASEESGAFVRHCREFMEERFAGQKPSMLSPEVTTRVYVERCQNLRVYDPDYFYPFNPYCSMRPRPQLLYRYVQSNTYAIHHYTKSWKMPLTTRIRRVIERIASPATRAANLRAKTKLKTQTEVEPTP